MNTDRLKWMTDKLLGTWEVRTRSKIHGPLQKQLWISCSYDCPPPNQPNRLDPEIEAFPTTMLGHDMDLVVRRGEKYQYCGHKVAVFFFFGKGIDEQVRTSAIEALGDFQSSLGVLYEENQDLYSRREAEWQWMHTQGHPPGQPSTQTNAQSTPASGLCVIETLPSLPNARAPSQRSTKKPPLKVSDVTFIEEHYYQTPYCSELVSLINGSGDHSQILWVYDPFGNTRKTSVLRYLEYHMGVEALPYAGSYKDFCKFARSYAGARTYGVDIPKFCNPSNNGERRKFARFIAGLESLKDGITFDGRGAMREAKMDRPHLFIFSTCKPIFDAATVERWRVVTITYRLEFEDITKSILEEHDADMRIRMTQYDMKQALEAFSLRKRTAKAISDQIQLDLDGPAKRREM